MIHRNDHASQLDWQAQYQFLLRLDFIAICIEDDAVEGCYQGCFPVKAQDRMTLSHGLPRQHHRTVIPASKQVFARREREAATRLGAMQHSEFHHAFLFDLAFEREACIA